MKMPFSGRRRLVVPAAAVLALAWCAGASAHAEVSPAAALAKHGQVFSLAVPTEEEGATTTEVELTVPSGFSIDSFVAAPGWKRDTKQTGSGEAAVIQKVTWTGGSVPTGEDAFFQFLGEPGESGPYVFRVRQTYSDGKVVDWSGDESSDPPAPTIDVQDSFGGGGGSSTLAVIALILGALGVVLGAAALRAGGGAARGGRGGRGVGVGSGGPRRVPGVGGGAPARRPAASAHAVLQKT